MIHETISAGKDGSVTRNILPLSLSFDHRLIGGEAARSLAAVLSGSGPGGLTGIGLHLVSVGGVSGQTLLRRFDHMINRRLDIFIAQAGIAAFGGHHSRVAFETFDSISVQSICPRCNA